MDPLETVIAEAGGFMMMDDGVEMATIFGDGTQPNKGLWGKVMSAGKRMLTGESLFMTAFTHNGHGKRKVSFAAPYPGRIIPIDLSGQDQRTHASGKNMVWTHEATKCDKGNY